MEKSDRINLPRRSRESQRQRDQAAQRYRHGERALQSGAVRDPAHQRLEQLLGDQVERKQNPGLSQTQPQAFVREDRQRKADHAETQPRQKSFGPDHQERGGDSATERRGDGETGRKITLNPCLLVPLSPCPPVSPSPCLLISHYFKQAASARLCLWRNRQCNRRSSRPRSARLCSRGSSSRPPRKARGRFR